MKDESIDWKNVEKKLCLLLKILWTALSETCFTKSFFRNQHWNCNQHWTSHYKSQLKTFHAKNTKCLKQKKPAEHIIASVTFERALQGGNLTISLWEKTTFRKINQKIRTKKQLKQIMSKVTNVWSANLAFPQNPLNSGFPVGNSQPESNQ